MNLQGWIVFSCFVIGPGLGWMIYELWLDRKEKKYGYPAKLALLPAWPVWGPIFNRRAKRGGQFKFIMSLILMPLATLLLAFSGWVGGNMIFYRSSMSQANKHLNKKEFQEAFRTVDMMAKANKNITTFPIRVKKINDSISQISNQHVQMWLQVTQMEVVSLWKAGKYSESEALAKESVKFVVKYLGRQNEFYAKALALLAGLHQQQGNISEAETLLQKAFATVAKEFGPSHMRTAIAAVGLARFYKEQKEYKKAFLCYQQAKPILDKALSPTHPNYTQVIKEMTTVKELAEQFKKKQ